MKSSELRSRRFAALIPLLVITAIAAVHATEQGSTAVPCCAGSGSCTGDLNQPLLELLQPAPGGKYQVTGDK